MDIDNATIEFVQGKYGKFGNNEERKKRLENEEEIKRELKAKYEKGELTHEEYLEVYDKQIQGKFRSLNQIDDFHLDNDIDIGSVYFVTREKQDPEYPDDSYLCYELYDKATGKLIANTDRENNLTILDDKLLEKYPQLEKQAKKMFRMATMDENTGRTVDNVVVKNAVDYEKEDKKELDRDIKEDREHTVYNKIDRDRNLTNGEEKEEDKEAETEEKLIQKANKSKSGIINSSQENNNDGKGKVVVAKLIEDPSVRDNIPDATVKTWMVMYENGEMGMLNGRGEPLESIIQINPVDRNIDSVASRGEDDAALKTTFCVKGRENGLVFPVTKEDNGQLQLNIQDRLQSPEIIIPVYMQGNDTVRDNMEYIYAQRIIDEILYKEEYQGLVEANPDISNRILELCYKHNDASVQTITQYIQIANENLIRELQGLDTHESEEDMEILTPEEIAMRRREGLL